MVRFNYNYAEMKWIDASAHLHAGSPTVSKNRQVPPFMQKSPAIGHGCSCLGQAAVAVTKSEKKDIHQRSNEEFA